MDHAIPGDHDAGEDAALLQSEQDRKTVSELSALAKVLHAPIPKIVCGDGPSGIMRKERRVGEGDKEYYFTTKDMKLVYYKTDSVGGFLSGSKPKGTITVRWIVAAPIGGATRERMAGHSRRVVSAHQLIVFSKRNRIFQLNAASDDTIDLFFKHLRQALKDNLSKDEYAARSQASQELVPLLQRTYVDEAQRAAALLAELTDSQMVSTRAKCDKQGSLSVRTWTGTTKKDGKGKERRKKEWKQQFFQLRGANLFYRFPSKTAATLGEGVRTDGVIALRFATVTPAVHPSKRDPTHMRWEFTITTPYKSYTLRAKHEASMVEWLTAIEVAQGRRKPIKSASSMTSGASSLASAVGDAVSRVTQSSTKGVYMSQLDLDGDGMHMSPADAAAPASAEMSVLSSGSSGGLSGPPPQYKKPTLEYSIPGKKTKKTFKLNVGRTRFGRSHSVNCCIRDDTKLSREHFAIDTISTKPTCHCILVDLGSKMGLQMDDKEVSRVYLKPGDRFVAGTTTFLFTAQQ